MSELGHISEAEFTKQVLALAKLHRWKTAHFRAAQTSKGWRTPVQGDGQGFPDIILVGGPRSTKQFLVVELKVGNNTLTDEQEEWLTAFQAASIPVYVWYPKNWLEIEKTLQGA